MAELGGSDQYSYAACSAGSIQVSTNQVIIDNGDPEQVAEARFSLDVDREPLPVGDVPPH